MDAFNLDTLGQQGRMFLNAPYIVLPPAIIVAIAVWWFRGTMFQPVIAGLREQIKVFGAQKTIFDTQMQITAEKLELERERQDSLARQINGLKEEVAKAGNDALAARVAEVERALAELSAASNAVSSALTGVLSATEETDIANFRGGIVE